MLEVRGRGEAWITLPPISSRTPGFAALSLLLPLCHPTLTNQTMPSLDPDPAAPSDLPSPRSAGPGIPVPSALAMEDADTNGVYHHAPLAQLRAAGDSVSRATSPGLGFSPHDAAHSHLEREKRYRPRTYPYFKLLPYGVEEEAERNNALEEILKQLYIAVRAEDISPGAMHWTRELRGWLNLKFEITRALRVRLVKLYYMLCLAPGIDSSAADRFESMFRTLTKWVLLSMGVFLSMGFLDWGSNGLADANIFLAGENTISSLART